MQGFRLELPCGEEMPLTAPCGFQLNAAEADAQPTLPCFDSGVSDSAAGPTKRFRRSSQIRGGQAVLVDPGQMLS